MKGVSFFCAFLWPYFVSQVVATLSAFPNEKLALMVVWRLNWPELKSYAGALAVLFKDLLTISGLNDGRCFPACLSKKVVSRKKCFQYRCSFRLILILMTNRNFIRDLLKTVKVVFQATNHSSPPLYLSWDWERKSAPPSSSSTQ